MFQLTNVSKFTSKKLYSIVHRDLFYKSFWKLFCKLECFLIVHYFHVNAVTYNFLVNLLQKMFYKAVHKKLKTSMGLIYTLFIKLDRFIIVQNFYLCIEMIRCYRELVNELQKCFIGLAPGVDITKHFGIHVLTLL
jgi:hypothetical protein